MSQKQAQMYKHFALLMEAPDKDLIQAIFTHVYMHRNDMTQANAAKYASRFGKPEKITEQLVQMVRIRVIGPDIS